MLMKYGTRAGVLAQTVKV